MKTSFSFALCLILMAACGGKVFVDPPGASGGGGGASSSSSSSSGVGLPCSSHADCPGAVCVFSTGKCAQKCDGDFCEACAPGTWCDSCATSSCPSCEDCRPACVPIQAGQCDDNDPCPAGQVCLFGFGAGFCAQSCASDGDCGGFEFCDQCATGSCCGCDNCVGACLGGE